jgi:phosphoribosylaminoimidazolecarboxamide formyltransferase/IMP cyclohydrolase/phosphoribosylaminoimidazolecarboxamide formyltransferase
VSGITVTSTLPLRYGTNPHQQRALVYMADGRKLPLEVLNGAPGYINLLDALNAWQLVRELRAALGLPAAASFKHVSPAGAAVGLPLSEHLRRAYFVNDLEFSPLATAYARARGADRVSSYGDWAALSDRVDVPTAQLLRREVSDGVIAPAYEPDAFELLKRKRQGRYTVLQVDPTYEPAECERREVFGITFEQQRNTYLPNQDLPRDARVAQLVLKYTQSNSICLVSDGQSIGIGAGQQSRIDGTRLACDKADLWYLRQLPSVLEREWPTDRVERDNAIDEHVRAIPPGERAAWLRTLSGVTLGSDAFFPFRDSIDRAARSGVSYVVQPGGALRDNEIEQACQQHGITMRLTGTRLFHH